jgi:1-acyl-sn-glycerol-3-phosphate acyltransferase
MAVTINVRKKNVPKLYETDESKYAGPHRWQVQPWARWVRRLMRWRAYTRWVEQAFERVDVVGAEHVAKLDAPCLFVANHQSHLDTLLVHAALPDHIKSRIYFGAAQDRWFIKGRKKLILKPWYQSLVLGNYPIHRGGGAKALSYAGWLLRKREHVFLFPEGTRATGDELGEFKHGAAILAIENQVPVVPIYLSGLQAIRPKGSRDLLQKGVAGVEFLAPMTFAPASDVSDATRALRDALSAVHGRSRSSVVERALPEAA